jgi:hypothetical protein
MKDIMLPYHANLIQKKIFFLFIFPLFFLFNNVNSQDKPGNKIVEYGTWALIRSIPSPVFFQDRNNDNSRLSFGLVWNIVPVNYSFGINKTVNPFSVLKVNPLKRFSGSIELDVQPEWTMNSYKYSDLSRFGLTSVFRLYIPMIEFGEYLCSSVGLKYTITNDKSGKRKSYFGLEAGTYTFFGILGFKFAYNFDKESRYNVGINLKYY